MEIEEAKQQIATKYGYSNFKAVLKNHWASERYVNEAMELYAKNQDDINWKEKYEKCIAVIKKFDAGIIGMYDL